MLPFDPSGVYTAEHQGQCAWGMITEITATAAAAKGKATPFRRSRALRFAQWRSWWFGVPGAWLRVALLFASCSAETQMDEAQPRSVQFTNLTAAAGIKFVHYRGDSGIPINREIFGPGVCVADFDQDGLQDIYFVNGRDLYERNISASNALYRNNGDGTFTDITEKAGVQGTGYGFGCVWGDYDNDGFPDLFVTQYGRNVLYHNNGDGTFTDVTDKARVGGTESGTVFHSSATFFDYDRDGRLDLYVGGYVNLDSGPRYCAFEGVRTSCSLQRKCEPSLSQQRRRNLYRCDVLLGNIRAAGQESSSGGRRLRQRRLARPVRRQ